MRHYPRQSFSQPLPNSVAEGESEALTMAIAIAILTVGLSVYLCL